MSTAQGIAHAISDVKKLLPEQGPLPYFVHHNPLHHFEFLSFEEGAKKAAHLYHARAFMSEVQFQAFFQSGRIQCSDLVTAIERFLKEQNSVLEVGFVLDLLTTAQPNYETSDQHIEAFIKKTSLPKRRYYRDAIATTFNQDIDELISPVVYKFLAAYFDFGSAYWTMPHREAGIWTAFSSLYTERTFFPTKFTRELQKTLHSVGHMPALAVIENLLIRLSIPTSLTSEYLFELLYRYKGWVALAKSLEANPDWVQKKEIHSSFVDVIAVFLCLEHAAVTSICNPQSLLMPQIQRTAQFHGGFLTLFCEKFGISHGEPIPDLLKPFTDLNRQSIWQQAYEESLYRQFLAAYRTSATKEKHPQQSPQWQVFCCIDEREESFRRYIEAVDSHCETYGVAGHFSLDMKYKGIFDKHFRALCPPVIKPEKYIWEEPYDRTISLPRSLALYGELQWIMSTSSKTLVRGFIQSMVAGFFNLIPYTLDIISPQLMAKVKRIIRTQVHKSLRTKVIYKGEHNDRGYTLDERVARAEGLLRGAGLISNFAPYVFMLGHGSSSLNNPHEAAHDCGACAGGRGAPNGRLIALILNEPEVRDELRKRGIDIPHATRFIGGYHNTCSDDVLFFDLPEEQTPQLKHYLASLQRAAALNARERCRRFEDVRSLPADINYYDYVQGRALDLTQPRPEYGHATNGFCIVGPRKYSRDLFTDRRAFLVSYDPQIDSTGDVLKGILGAVGPVCAGISLEYYFSYIDNEHYGCGTKLPHNVTSLVGVINGFQSDLLLGLPWQMVEIHEPTRLLMIVCCPVERMQALLEQSGPFQVLVKNRWIMLVLHNENENTFLRYTDGHFEPVVSDEISPRYERDDLRFFYDAEHLQFGTFD